MATTFNALDLTTCDREPIHIPGSIQPHGFLFALAEPDLLVMQASSNVTDYLGLEINQVVGAPLTKVFDQSQADHLIKVLQRAELDESPVYLRTVSSPVTGRAFYAIAHRFAGAIIVEFEPTDSGTEISFQELYSVVRKFVARLRTASTLEALAQLACNEIRRLTGFDRVLVYKFAESWNGHVIAESRTETCSSFLDLWFPASDIPQQARNLYALNRFRLIADAAYRPVPLTPAVNPATGKPLDMSFAALRSVSPVHIEYLKNMGVVSSMSLSVLVNDKRLWGLISCHHSAPRLIPFNLRTACDLLSQSFSVHVEAVEQRAEYERRIVLKSLTARLLGFMAQEEDFIAGLTRHPEELLRFAQAQGAAVLYRGHCITLGICPEEKQIWRLADWLIERGRDEVYHTDALGSAIDGEPFRERASGLLAISISKLHKSYVLWFRPEVVQTVKWSGDPHKPVESGDAESGRLSPRKSFEIWKQIVHGRSSPWELAEQEAALELRNAIIGVVLRKAEELAELSAELQRSNKELETFSYSVSHDLRAPFRHILGYAELLKQSPTAQLAANDSRYLNIIVESAKFAGLLVDNLLGFSQVGRAKLNLASVDMNSLVLEVKAELQSETQGRQIDWKIDVLPAVEGDPVMLCLVWQNLIQNALKYSRTRECTLLEIASSCTDDEFIFSVRDNGVGFESAYAEKLFGVFQRLHRAEDYEGTGIGLANVRRMIARHGGRTWAQGAINEGACFFFSIPRRIQHNAGPS